jgi:hypothetical protein
MEIPIGIGMKKAGFKAVVGAPFAQDDFVISRFKNFGIHHYQAFGAKTPGHFQENGRAPLPGIFKYVCLF